MQDIYYLHQFSKVEWQFSKSDGNSSSLVVLLKTLFTLSSTYKQITYEKRLNPQKFSNEIKIKCSILHFRQYSLYIRNAFIL